MDLEIPDEQYMAHGLREAARHYDLMPPDEYKALMLSLLVGYVMELERRLIAVERRLGAEGAAEQKSSHRPDIINTDLEPDTTK